MNHVTELPEQGLGAHYALGLTAGDHSARHLRRILRAHLAAWEMLDLVDAACLALTELIANVVRHVPGGRCAVRVVRTPAGVRVEVGDGHPGIPVVATTGRDEPAEDGRGLLIVSTVTARWGVTPNPLPVPGKVIWFECDAGRV
ncbi:MULTISPECIES: ATP-binding protein [unclassified Streptomyces]|uniref:ATP-binding protein n=1 Tax=unclassified Streptomyces TaxID=2593676 RepID=UPI002E36B0A1|nr:ATP-binding protein [Streptomyces sp. NBC_01280]